MQTFSITYYILSLYNNGILLDKCFTIDQDTTKEDHQEEVSEWLKEESENHDQLFEEVIVCDSDIPSIFINQWSINSEFWEFLDALNDCSFSHLPIEVLAKLYEENGSFDVSYWGKFNTLIDFGWSFCEESGLFDGWPDVAINYFDCEQYARDLSYDGLTIIDNHYFL